MVTLRDGVMLALGQFLFGIAIAATAGAGAIAWMLVREWLA